MQISSRESAPLSRSTGTLLLIAAASFLLIAAPDLAFHMLGYQTASVLKPESVMLAGVVGLAVTLVRGRKARFLALAVVLLSQLVWLGCLAYFGRPLGPEQVLLAKGEAADVGAGIVDGWRVLLPPAATVLATGLALIALQRIELPEPSLRSTFVRFLFPALVLGCAGYWLSHTKFVVSIPGSQTLSALGPYQAVVSAARLLMSPVAPAPGMTINDQTKTPVALEEEPVTVVVVMGEGISPYRLSLFGFEKDTTPRLRSWTTAPPPGFALIPRVGISGGVATFGSVPALIKMSYWPVEAEWRGLNLFELANRNGFKTWFLSAQSRHFLDVAGGAAGAERVVVEQGNQERLARQHDDLLAELAREIPQDSPRRFVFFHQRVNHSNYTSHCSHLAEDERKALYAIAAVDGTREARRTAAYENGLRCWDRNVDDIVRAFTGAKGAVHILITADHGEMMGEYGMWGHSQPDLRVAQVPVLLLTNRPQSEIARRFSAFEVPHWYLISQLIARSLGYEVITPGTSDRRFYLNTTMPFGRSGYFEVDVLKGGRFALRHYTREGQLQRKLTIELPNLAKSNATAGVLQAR